MSDSLDTYTREQVTGRFFYSRDHTHTSAEGAMLSASLVVKGLRAMPDFKLTQYLLKNPHIVFPVKKRVFLIGDSTVANGNDTLLGGGRELRLSSIRAGSLLSTKPVADAAAGLSE
jgi:hypothetical protein